MIYIGLRMHFILILRVVAACSVLLQHVYGVDLRSFGNTGV